MVDRNGKPRLGRQQIDETLSEIESETPGEDWHHGDWAHLYICQWRFAVTPLLSRTKQAYRSQWQKHPITDAMEAQRHWTERPDDGIGAVLGPSGLASVDIDSPERATAALKALGIDLDALSHRADIPKIEGAPGRYRLLFRAPSGAALPYQTLAVPRESAKEIMVLELRAGLVQDVLPPSIHPDTGLPYRWIRAPWETGGIPALPKELLALWRRWDEFADELRKTAGIKKKTTKAVIHGTTKSPSRRPRNPLPISIRPARGGDHAEAQDVVRFVIDPRIAESQPDLTKTLVKLLGRLEEVTGSGREWSARCPAHRDLKPSLAVGISDDDRKILVYCHAGCETEDVVAEIGMEMRDLYCGGVARVNRPCPSQKLKTSSNGEAAPVGVTQRPVGSTSHSEQESKRSDYWSDLAQKYEKALTRERLDQLAGSLGVPAGELKRLGVGWRQPVDKPGCYTIPEHDGKGAAIGVATRQLNGEKKAIQGSRRGLTLVKDWSSRLREVSKIFIVEGPSDVAAAGVIGIFAIGRPSARGGVEMLTELLGTVRPEQEVIVVGENDAKPDGTWPGRDGAEVVAQKLAAQLGRSIGWVLPPTGAKDLRAWLKTQEEEA